MSVSMYSNGLWQIQSHEWLQAQQKWILPLSHAVNSSLFKYSWCSSIDGALELAACTWPWPKRINPAKALETSEGHFTPLHPGPAATCELSIWIGTVIFSMSQWSRRVNGLNGQRASLISAIDHLTSAWTVQREQWVSWQKTVSHRFTVLVCEMCQVILNTYSFTAVAYFTL